MVSRDIAVKGALKVGPSKIAKIDHSAVLA
jgi:hypothetical protein